MINKSAYLTITHRKVRPILITKGRPNRTDARHYGKKICDKRVAQNLHTTANKNESGLG